MKILFIFTGGTIGSTADGEIISIDNGKPYRLLKEYGKRHKLDFKYVTAEPYSALSENSTGEELKKLCECVKANLNGGYDGIIVTHGTDTLQYSASALSYIAGKSSIPVCLVSSNFIIEDERSNAIANLHGAIEFIRRGKEQGVWVPYKNTGDFIRIHRASRLLASDAFSDDVFSAQGSWYGYFDGDMNFIKNPDYKECDDKMAPLSASGIGDRCESVLRVEPYVGMTYPEIGDKVKYVLLGSYHSGTINTASPSARQFYEAAYKKGVKVFLTGVYVGKAYESTESFNELHITPLFNVSPISAYIKLWLCENSESIVEVMNTPLGGDM